MDNQDKKERQGTGFLNILKSTLFAAGGVQTKTNRERDFEQGKPSAFVAAGIIFIVLFVLGMIGVVKLVMTFAAP